MLTIPLALADDLVGLHCGPFHPVEFGLRPFLLLLQVGDAVCCLVILPALASRLHLVALPTPCRITLAGGTTRAAWTGLLLLVYLEAVSLFGRTFEGQTLGLSFVNRLDM